jgi:hypothetical protein
MIAILRRKTAYVVAKLSSLKYMSASGGRLLGLVGVEITEQPQTETAG